MASLDWLFNSNPMALQSLSGLFGDMPFDERYAPAAQATQPGAGPGNWDWFGPSPGPGAQPPQQQAMAFNQPQAAPSFPALPQMRNTSQPGDANFYGGSPEGNRNLQPFGARPPQMAAGAMAQAPTMPPTGQSPGAMDRFSAGLQGAGSSFMNGGGPIGALVNLIGGLSSGKRTDPEGVNQEEMMKQYQSWQKDFNLTPAQARMMVLNKEYMKEGVKPVANPSYVTGPNGVIYSQGPNGLSPAAVAPKPEFMDTFNPTTGRMEKVAVTPPTGLSPMTVTRPGQTSGQAGGPMVNSGGLVVAPSALEKSRAESLGKGYGEQIGTIATDGLKAQEDKIAYSRLSGLLRQSGTGASSAFVNFVREHTGIALSEKAGLLEGSQALLSYLTPRMRGAGTGSTSDRDMKLYGQALPSLLSHPVGREIAIETLGGMAQFREARGAIAQDIQAGVITEAEGLKRMKALPDPFKAFKEWHEKGGVEAMGATPRTEAVTIPQGMSPQDARKKFGPGPIITPDGRQGVLP